MPRFFVKPEQVLGDRIIIEGPDVNHISRVLRMKVGEELTVSDGSGTDYYCTISSLDETSIMLDVTGSWASYSELPVKITLFQGLPKADKMELIIQKTVELGVYEIVPVSMSRCIVKLDDKKSLKKTARWQSIAESAAKQSGRAIIPAVREPMTYGHALQYAQTMDAILLPYENASGIEETRRIIGELSGHEHIGIFVGPEGGYSDEEVARAEAAGARIITLGKRILRTETAGMAAMAILMFAFEKDEQDTLSREMNTADI